MLEFVAKVVAEFRWNSSSIARRLRFLKKKNKPPAMAQMATTPTTTPAAMLAVFELFAFVPVLLGFCAPGTPGAVTMTVLACVTITDAGRLLVLSGVGEAAALVAGEVAAT